MGDESDDKSKLCSSFREWLIKNDLEGTVEQIFTHFLSIANGNVVEAKADAVSVRAAQVLLEAVYGKPPTAEMLDLLDGHDDARNVKVHFTD